MATWKELLEAKKLTSQPKADGALQSPSPAKESLSNSSLINSAWNSPLSVEKPVPLSLAERLAAIKSKKNPLSVEKPATLIVSISSAENPSCAEKEKKKESFSLNVEYDEDQLNAIALAKSGKSFVLIGAAGSGKTTVERGIMLALLAEMKDTETHDFRIQGTSDRSVGPGIAIAAPTRIASGNSRKAICKSAELAEKCFYNVTTNHNLLEYYPEFFFDEEKEKESMRFIPKRTRLNPLTTKTIMFEEASMNDLTIWEKIYDAMAYGTQVIFIGDINQLPPVFGPSILNYALVQLPIIELRTVYRQEEGSSILDNAHRILKGEEIVWDKDFQLLEGNKEVQHGQRTQCQIIMNSVKGWLSSGKYDPEQDIFLTPFNVRPLGSSHINYCLASLINKDADVWEIVAGVRKLYVAVGDKIMYNKQIGRITEINHNGLYSGSPKPKHHSVHLSRFGHYLAGASSLGELEEEPDNGLASFKIDLEEMTKEDVKELSRQASAVVTIVLDDTEEEIKLSKVGDLSESSFSLAYALTVHKAQGCEWRKVFLLLHKDHSIMAFRELLYTAVTRAREQVVIIGKQFMIDKAIQNPRIKGNSIREKVEFFNANQQMREGVLCEKR
jgi:exodeoxyribonuclease V alpha subunit